MENCDYTKILYDVGVEISVNEKKSWKPLLRQCLIVSGVCCVNFMQGLFLGAPTVLVAQIRRDVSSTDFITDDMLSWLTSFPVISSVPSIIILPVLFNRIGRKLTFLFVYLFTVISFIIFYISTNVYHLLISSLFAGPALASTITISPIIITEYTSPKYRGIFLSLKGATAYWGIWISNAVGTFFYWKNIAIVSFVCSVLLITFLAWPESPFWLARKALYVESAKSHRWLKGVSENSEKELAQLIISQKIFNNVHLSLTDDNNLCSLSRLSTTWSIITLPQFYKPASICILLLAQYHFTGKVVISMYAIEILRRLSSDESIPYKEMLILDGVTVFSMYVGCVNSRYFKRRTLLLIFSGIGILVLYLLSLYLYLVSLSVIMQSDIVILFLLIAFSIVISCGPIILCTSICGEIIPPCYQNLAITFVGSSGVIIMSLLLKLSPLIFRSFKMSGTFLFFAISSTIILSVVYIYLPETKDKTIQDIEKIFMKSQVKEGRTTANKGFELNNLL